MAQCRTAQAITGLRSNEGRLVILRFSRKAPPAEESAPLLDSGLELNLAVDRERERLPSTPFYIYHADTGSRLPLGYGMWKCIVWCLMQLLHFTLHWPTVTHTHVPHILISVLFHQSTDFCLAFGYGN